MNQNHCSDPTNGSRHCSANGNGHTLCHCCIPHRLELKVQEKALFKPSLGKFFKLVKWNMNFFLYPSYSLISAILDLSCLS